MTEKQVLERQIVKLGNSAGVVLPREWLNGRAKIQLVEKPLDIKSDVFNILSQYLEEAIGIYLVGSYARGEQTNKSDVDVLVITDKTNKKINVGKYHLILITQKSIEDVLMINVMPILPMIMEAKPLLNSSWIKRYREAKITKRNLRWHLEIIKSGLKLIKLSMSLGKELERSCSDSTAYSLILHLRSIYIVDCLKKKRLWGNREFLKLIKEISGSLRAYDGYLRVKNDNKILMDGLPLQEAEKLYDYISKKIKEQEKWLKAKKE